MTLRRAPVTTDRVPATDFVSARPAAPARLVLEPRPRAFATPASARRVASDAQPRTVALSGLSNDLPATTGIAVFLPVTGALFDWQPLPADRGADPDAIDLAIQAPAREVLLTLAPSAACARHSYFAQTTADFTKSERATFALALATVEFSTQDVDHTGPLQLRRLGHPEWHPSGAAAAGLRLTRNATPLLLGAGDYELVDPVRPKNRQAFTVPTAAPIVLDARLALPRGRKP